MENDNETSSASTFERQSTGKPGREKSTFIDGIQNRIPCLSSLSLVLIVNQYGECIWRHERAR